MRLKALLAFLSRSLRLCCKRVSVRARDGSMVSLDNLITYDETISPASIFRFNRNVSATISARATSSMRRSTRKR